MILQLVKRGWQRSSRRLAGSDWFWMRTAATMVLLDEYKRTFKAYLKGTVLDAGAGTLSARYLVKRLGFEYKSLDLEKHHLDIDYVGDVQKMPIADASFDSVVCLQVLEHVPNPQKAIAEIYRVLKPGGTAIVSVPFLLYLHNEPNDYWRYTKHSLRNLFTEAGFEIVELQPLAGLLSFLHHLVFTPIVGLLENIPILRALALTISQATGRLAIWLDRLIDPKRLCPLYYNVVISKRA